MTDAPDARASALQHMSAHRWAVAIRRGFLLSLPLVMAGAFALALGHAPLPAGWAGETLQAWQQLCGRVGQASFGIMSLCVAMTISHALASQQRTGDINPLSASLVALMSFMAVMLPSDGNPGAGLFSTRSVFPATVIAIAATEIFLCLCRTRLLHMRTSFSDADPLLPGLLRAIVPAMLTVCLFVLVGQLLGWSEKSASTMASGGLQALFAPIDSPLLRALAFNVLNQLLWFFGAHGNNILSSVDYFDAATAANAAAVAAGQVPTEFVTKPFLDIFVFMGGSGTVLGLLIAVLIVCRSGSQQRLARISALPAMFNISEILVFGLPVVLNPMYLIPFVITPLVLVITTYFACAVEFIPPIHQALPWTTPPLVGGYLATGSWRGTAMQLINLGVAVVIYLPFVHAAQRDLNRIRKENFRTLMKEMGDIARDGNDSGILSRNDPLGGLARQLASDLLEDTRLGRVRLVYQPQVNRVGRVVGVEALLRWDHAVFGSVPPHIAVAIAEEARLICPLGDWVIDQACAQLKEWRNQGEHEVRMSINISPTQLHEAGFVQAVRDTLRRHQLSASEIELEVTEGRAIGHDDATAQALAELADMGIHLAMDDFGMGYSSLLYMRRFNIHAIKLDGSLTREVLTNRSCQEIIETIAHLCHNKEVRIVAEFVETEAQRDLLSLLGCSEYQGYLYSKPLPPAECIAFIGERHAAHAAVPSPTSAATRLTAPA